MLRHVKSKSAYKMQRTSRRINFKVWFILIILALIPVIGTVSPGGLGIGEDQEITNTVERDSTGKVIKQTEVKRTISGRTVWDWLNLLGVPLVLTFLGLWLQEAQQKQANEQAEIEKAKEAARIQAEKAREEQRIQAEREIAENNQREEAIQAYFDRVSALLIDKNLIALASKIDQKEEGLVDEEIELFDATKDVIRAATLSILRRLRNDGHKKRFVIQFLIESKVLSKLRLSLQDADLRGADLNRLQLQGIDLCHAELLNANFISADLHGAKLEHAKCSNANFSYAILNDANLAKASLDGASLSRSQIA